MGRDSDANGWRLKMIDALPEHEFWNPIEKERPLYPGEDLMERLKIMKADGDLGGMVGLSALRRIMLEQIIPLDVEGVTWADALVCRVKRDIRMFGSICEIYEAKRVQNKPVYLISDYKYSEMNSWEIALADKIWCTLKGGITGLRGLI